MDRYLKIHQARTADPTPYEVKLAKAIEAVFGSGVHHLEGLVKGLNDSGIHGPDGAEWTPESFTAEMHRIGA
ncbi:recombinase-like helix-turn-helix domain-containing protein [Rhodococcus sp. NPDC003382]